VVWAIVPQSYAEIPLSFAEFLFFAVQIADSVICKFVNSINVSRILYYDSLSIFAQHIE